MNAALRVATLACAACAAASASCNLIFSVSGYAGASGADASTLDGAVLSDANVARDAGPMVDDGPTMEGAVAADACADLGGAFCAGAIFCDQFDRPDGDVQGAWMTVDESSGGSLAIAPTGPSCHALEAREILSDAGTEVFLDERTGSMAKTVTLEFGALLAITSTVGGVHVNTLVFDAPGTTSFVFPYVNGSDGLFIGELVCTPTDAAYPCVYGQSAGKLSFEAGTWHELSLTVDFTATPAAYTLVVDNQSLSSTSAHGAVSGQVEVYGGAVIDPSAGPIDLFVDQLRLSGH